MTEDDRENVIQQGIDAWHQLKKSWEHWRMVGKALLVGREWAMHHAGTNKPEGRGYNLAFGTWLEKYKLHDIDQGDRKRLFEVMDHLVEIEGWRAGLTEGERRKLNHPSTVLRKWKKATKVPSEEEKPKKATLTDSVRELDTRVYDLTEEKKEIEASYEQLKSENESLRARVEKLSDDNKQLDGELNGLEEELESYKFTAIDVAEDMEQELKDNVELEALGNKLEKQTNKMEKQIENHRKVFTSLVAFFSEQQPTKELNAILQELRTTLQTI